ncbi:zinc finger BED domain-containing protein 1-like [Myripristis murdjan]|uniref:zinc finger BED domain-containing protein 1-like n=1 Tax=Myripristis murdjan TaxID=586833 RepID=UPI001175DB16|nr:zinc finger BED domain-containing protein 1-like [Myripristis murdjan]
MADSDRIYNAPAGLKSKVWRKFGFYMKDGLLDKSVAICKECKAALKYTGSTTNLNTHLVRRHGETGDEEASTASAKTRQDTDIQEFFQPKLSHNSARAMVITASIARFIVKDLRPYSVVENEGFRDMIKTLEPRYTIPSRQHFTDKCVPELYNKVKNEVKEQLFNTERVAITTDAWTSCATDSYVTITAHHISPDWELRSHVLQTRVFNESHTGKNIGALLKEACTDWNIAHKEPALVTDNARNMIAAGVEAEMTPHLSCFAHTLNLASQKAFQVDTAARLLGKVRKVVGFLHRNIKGAEILREKQQQLTLPSHKLIQDVSTRWNSSHDMLERFLEQQPAVFATLMSRELRKGEEVNSLNEKDICNAEDIVRLMAPVKVVTTILCEDEMPTVSMIAPLRAKLKKHFEAADEDTPLITEMKKAFKNDFEKRYTHLEDLLYTASAIDPRFKTLPFLSDDDAERIFISISAEATALLNKVSQTNTPFH